MSYSFTLFARHFTSLRLLIIVISMGLLIVIPWISYTWYDQRFIVIIFISALMFGILGAVYDLMIGYAGLTNFGYAGFIAAGAYTSALLNFHYGINPWFGLLFGGIVASILGLLTGLITLRLRGLYVGLTTWFVAEALRFSISNTPEYTRGVLGLTVVPYPDLWGVDFSRQNILAYYYLLVILTMVIFISMYLLVHSKMGLSFKAMREDELATEVLGVNTTKYKLLNFTLACFFTGVIGSFYAHYLGILSPTPEEFGVPRTVEVLTITYVGGRGTLWGSLLAGFLLVGFQEYFRNLGPWRLVMFGMLLIIIMIFAPKGLAGLKNYMTGFTKDKTLPTPD